MELPLDGGVVLGGGRGSHASPTQAIEPVTEEYGARPIRILPCRGTFFCFQSTQPSAASAITYHSVTCDMHDRTLTLASEWFHTKPLGASQRSI